LYNNLGRAPGISAGTRCAYGGRCARTSGLVAVIGLLGTVGAARRDAPAGQRDEAPIRLNPGPSQVVTDLALISSGE
jgi:hypothetical protein